MSLSIGIFFHSITVIFCGILIHRINGNFFFQTAGTADDALPVAMDNKTRSANYFLPMENDGQTDIDGLLITTRLRPPECLKPVVNCQPLFAEVNITNYLNSVDVSIMYTFYVADLPAANIIGILRAAELLRHHDACWDVVQPLVYAVTIPECLMRGRPEKKLIPQKHCLQVEATCGQRVLRWLGPVLGDLLNCSNPNVYTNNPGCDETSWADATESNISSSCPFPLVQTNDSIKHIFENGECGMQCENPWIEKTVQHSLHIYVAALVFMSFIFNGSAFILMVRRWKNLKKYPDQCLLFINVCFLMSDVGWAIQFFPGAKHYITCAEDGTERLNEPRHGESYALCLITFILIYYFMMAAALWFVTMSYCWYRSFRALYTKEAKAKGFLKSYSPYFHIFAWVSPLLMTFGVVASSGIDGNNTTGVCFIGMRWGLVRVLLLLLPLVLVALVSGFFMVRGLYLLYRLKSHQDHSLSTSDRKHIRSTMVHIGFIAVAVYICIFTSVFIHVHYYIYQSSYEALRHTFIQCHLENAVRGERVAKCLPHISMDYETVELGVHLGLQFLAGIIFSSWVWRHNRLYAWVKIIRRRLRNMSVAVQRISTTVIPMTAMNGKANAAFVHDVPVDAPVATSTNSEISTRKSSENMYDSLDNLEDGSVSMRDMGFGGALSDGDSVFSSSPMPTENRLENWQNMARDVRTEKRKISAVVVGRTNCSLSSGTILQGTVTLDDTSVEIIMDPFPTPAPLKRQRRPGRVEHFKQRRSHSPMGMDSPVSRSASEIDMDSSDDHIIFSSSVNNNNSLQVPGRKISRIRMASPLGQVISLNRSSPDEGIDVERAVEDGPRASPQDKIPSLKIVIDDTEITKGNFEVSLNSDA